jgi:hypothetical protein
MERGSVVADERVGASRLEEKSRTRGPFGDEGATLPRSRTRPVFVVCGSVGRDPAVVVAGHGLLNPHNEPGLAGSAVGIEAVPAIARKQGFGPTDRSFRPAVSAASCEIGET